LHKDKAKLDETNILVPIESDYTLRGLLGYIRKGKKKKKSSKIAKPQKKICPKPKTAYKIVKNRYNGDERGIQSKLH